MSEERETKTRFRPTTVQFISFLEKKTPDSKCPACGNEDWTVLGESADYPYEFSSIIERSGKLLAFPYYMIACTNCGMLRHHLAGVVNEAIQSGILNEPDSDAQ